MSEQLCICGHLYELHHAESYETVTGAIRWISPCDDCDCCKFRDSLRWPDSKGNWWCDKFDIPLKVSRDVHGFIVGEHDTWFRQKEFESLLCGPARFTKLLEQNPFAAPPTQSEKQ
jgi:hypothetical protein